MTLKIAIIVGSLRRESLNRRAAQALVPLLGEGVQVEWVPIHDLPLYNQDEEANPTEAVKRLREQIRSADGVLFVGPEYNRSLSGAMKNALDHGSRPWGQSVWSGKPAAMMGVSPSAVGTAVGQQHLRTVLGVLNMPLLPGHEMYVQWKDEMVVDGQFAPQSREFFQKFANAFVAWVDKTRVR